MSFSPFFGGRDTILVEDRPNLFLQDVIYKNCANKLKYAVHVVSSVRDFFFFTTIPDTLITKKALIVKSEILCMFALRHFFNQSARRADWFSKSNWREKNLAREDTRLPFLLKELLKLWRNEHFVIKWFQNLTKIC